MINLSINRRRVRVSVKTAIVEDLLRDLKRMVLAIKQHLPEPLYLLRNHKMSSHMKAPHMHKTDKTNLTDQTNKVPIKTLTNHNLKLKSTIHSNFWTPNLKLSLPSTKRLKENGQPKISTASSRISLAPIQLKMT